jgi:hypothetical protein
VPGLSTIVDPFTTDVLDAVWASSHGTIGAAAGRAFVECGPGFPALRTADAYSLDSFYLEARPAAAAGATGEASTGVWVQSPSSPGGTDIGFLFDAVNGVLSLRSRSGYFDGAAVDVAHTAPDPIWVRLRIVAGDALWDTSADGVTWANRRTSVAPAWVLAATDVRLLFEAHRSDGTTNFSEFDNLNFTPVPTTTARPSEGVTPRPAGGSTVRPSTGVTARPQGAL